MANSFPISLESASITTKSYSLTTQGIGTGKFYMAGFYDAPVSSSTLTIGGTVSQALGSSGNPYSAHVFIVAGGAGGSGISITVHGDSINDAGVEVLGNSEVLIADASTLALNQYIETSLKFTSTVTIEITGGAGSVSFNYGWDKYEDFGNSDFTLMGFETLTLAGANDSSFEIKLFKHSSINWTYSAGAFAPGGELVQINGNDIQLTNIISTNNNLVNGQECAFKIVGINDTIHGSNGNGLVIEVTTGTNNSIEISNAHLGVVL